MQYYAAFLRMKDLEKSRSYRPQYLDFLVENEKAGRIFARGKFADNSGGLVIYRADSLEDARQTAENDPYILCGARELELNEWEMRVAGKQPD